MEWVAGVGSTRHALLHPRSHYYTMSPSGETASPHVAFVLSKVWSAPLPPPRDPRRLPPRRTLRGWTAIWRTSEPRGCARQSATVCLKGMSQFADRSITERFMHMVITWLHSRMCSHRGAKQRRTQRTTASSPSGWHRAWHRAAPSSRQPSRPVRPCASPCAPPAPARGRAPERRGREEVSAREECAKA